MAGRNKRVMLFDGREVMMTDAEAKQYYNNLERTDQGALLVPGGSLATTGLSKLGGPLSRYFNNLFGTTARTTGANVAKNTKNIANNFRQRVDNARKLNLARAGKDTIPNAINKTAANTRLGTLRDIEKQLLTNAPRLTKANNLAKASRDTTRAYTAGAGTIGALATAEALYDPENEAQALAAIDAETNATINSLNQQPVVADDLLRAQMMGDNLEGEQIRAVNEGLPKQKFNAALREEAINNLVEKEMKAAKKAVDGPVSKKKIAPKKSGPKKAVKQKTISSDPGYKDGYRVDNVDASNKLSVHNIMSADDGLEGQGYEW